MITLWLELMVKEGANMEYTKEQVISAVKSFVEFGEQSYGNCHKGYFSGSGFAAVVLRYHLEQLKKEQTERQ